MNKPIFRDYKLPVARDHGRLPIFLDFSSGWSLEDSVSQKFTNELISQSLSMIDGIILSSRNLHDLDPISFTEVWVRIDNGSTSTPAGSAQNGTHPTHKMFLDLLQNGVSGIVGSLVLGASSSEEADNIQDLAFQRSLSMEIGLPLAIDVRVVNQPEEASGYLEIVELGLNLAVELGCNIAIIPGGNYLALDNNMARITELPVLIQQPVSQIIDSQSQETLKSVSALMNGIILTDINQWIPCNINATLFSNWSESLLQNSNGV